MASRHISCAVSTGWFFWDLLRREAWDKGEDFLTGCKRVNGEPANSGGGLRLYILVDAE